MNIQHKDDGERGKFFVNENNVDIAQMIYIWSGSRLITIEHTEVSDQLKGQGVGNKLIAFAVDWARKKGIKIIPVCPFAKAVLTRKPEYADVLATK